MTSHATEHLCKVARYQDVLYVGHSVVDYRLVLNEVRRIAPDAATRVAIGDEHVTFPEGGTITFATTRTVANRARGLSIDHVFLDDHRPLDDRATREALASTFKHGDERYTVIG